MANRLAHLQDHEILYVLTRSDVESVAEGMVEDMRLDRLPNIVDILPDVQRGLEAGLGEVWTDYVEIAIDNAVR